MRAFRWKFADRQPDLATQIARDHGCSTLLAQCLVNRGAVTPAAAAQFLQPKLAALADPFLLPNMSAAVQRLLAARQQQERFVIFGDYDVDGVTSTALLATFFRDLGWHAVYYLPHRIEEGYGLTAEAVDKCLDRFPVKLLLAVDCGSTSADLIRRLQSRGVDVIVLDHHQLAADLPPAAALVNPQLLKLPTEFTSLCSAGLAFKLAHALLKRGRELNWPEAHQYDLRQLLDLVALGTICDRVPLQAENRTFVRTGLARLDRTDRVGLQALKSVAAVAGKVGVSEVGFQLGPRLNAAGRLETALDALELLLTDNPDRASALARDLDEQNRERQRVEQEMAREVIASLKLRFDPARDFAIVEGSPHWHIGVVGIVAARVVREFHRPAVILGSDGSAHWRGSGRSVEGFDLASGLRQCANVLERHGGHAMAAGVTLDPDRLSEFRDRLNSIARETLTEECLHPCLRLDEECNLADLTFNQLAALENLGPFGQGNPPVQFAARRLALRSEPRRFGKEQQHLRFQVTDHRTVHTAVWWNCPLEMIPGPLFDLAFVPELNEYNGTVAIQLRVLDLKPSS